MNDHIPDLTKMIIDGGPAFPHSLDWGWSDKLKRYEAIGYNGMTLRDYFAGKALQGLLASIQPNQLWSGDDVAVTCYRTADAMIKAREVK